MNIAEQIYESVKPMPEALAREVLDFVTFIALRQAQREGDDLVMPQSLSLTSWDNPEDEVWNDVPAV